MFYTLYFCYLSISKATISINNFFYNFSNNKDDKIYEFVFNITIEIV